MIQCIIENFESERYKFIEKIYKYINILATDKCASNIIEKCILFSNTEYKKKFVDLLLSSKK